MGSLEQLPCKHDIDMSTTYTVQGQTHKDMTRLVDSAENNNTIRDLLLSWRQAFSATALADAQDRESADLHACTVS